MTKFNDDFDRLLRETVRAIPDDDSILTQEEANLVSWATYCEALDRIRLGMPLTEAVFQRRLLSEGIWDDIKSHASGLAGGLAKVFTTLKDELAEISAKFKIGLGDLVAAFKHRQALAFFKAIKFNLGLALKAVQAGAKALRSGVLSVFEELAKTGVIKKLRSGAMKIDEVLDAHPILKKVGGLAIAGLLLYIWFNGAFTGDIDTDMNIAIIPMALAGSYSIADLFLSPAGLQMVTLFGLGFTGIGVLWTGAKLTNLLIALCYTLFTRIKDQKAAAALRSGMEIKKVGG